MAKNVSWSCPKCGLTKAGFRTERGANGDLQAHMYRKHPAPRPPRQEVRLLKY